MDTRDTSINVARSYSCIRLFCIFLIAHSSKRRKRPKERKRERVAPPLLSTRLPPSLRLAEFLSFLATSRRLITPSPSTEIFLYVYGSCICKISMSLHPLTPYFIPPLLFLAALSSPFPLRSFLNSMPDGIYAP